jgi:hypothetical protein
MAQVSEDALTSSGPRSSGTPRVSTTGMNDATSQRTSSTPPAEPIRPPSGRASGTVAREEERETDPEADLETADRENADRATGVSSRAPGSGSFPTHADLVLVNQLSASRLLTELDGPELRAICEALGGDGPGRVLDLVERYYAASGDADASLRRRRGERYFACRSSEAVTARELVKRLNAINPELTGPDGRPGVKLEKIGGDDGALVLRWGDHFAGIEDDEEELDTGEIDLRDLDPHSQTVTVRGLVHAINRLLDRAEIRDRMIALRSDGEREVYVGLSLADAMTLCREDLLDEDDPEELMEQAGW